MKHIIALLIFAGISIHANAEISDEELALIPAKVVVNSADLKEALNKYDKRKHYQGVPTIASTPSGKMIYCAWFGGKKEEGLDNIILVSALERTRGKSDKWSGVKFAVVHDNSGFVRVGDPCLWSAPNGKLYLFWFQNIGRYIGVPDEFQEPDKRWREAYDRRGGVFFSVCENPDSDTPNWSAGKRLCDGILINKPIALKDGKTWLLPVASPPKNSLNDIHTHSEGSRLYKTVDELNSLKLINVFPDTCEPVLVEKKDGTLWVLARIDTSIIRSKLNADGSTEQISFGNCGIVEYESKDGGHITTPQRISRIPHPSSRFQILRLRSGNLLLIKNNANDESWLNGKPRGVADMKIFPRERLTAYVSRNDGLTWEGGLELDSRKRVSYPDADESRDGYIYIAYDRGRNKFGEILSAKITEDEILKGKLSDKNSFFLKTVSSLKSE